MKPKIVTLAAAALLMWALKRHYADAPVDALRWILGPTAWLVTLVTRTPFEWAAGEGYLSRERLFVIEKACAGINFMIAAVGMVAFAVRGRITSWITAVDVLVLSVVTGYGAALVVNATRIALALWLTTHPLPGQWMSAAQAHRIEGIVVYFGGLVVLYEIVRRVGGRSGSLITPLCAYYAIAIAVPFANGAAAQGVTFVWHTLVVLTVPLAIVLAYWIVIAPLSALLPSLR